MNGHLVLAACTAHSPGMCAFPERADPERAARIFDAFGRLDGEIGAARPDAIVVVSGEHFTNFSVANLPTLAVGTASYYPLPATPAFSEFLHIAERRHPGSPELGASLYAGLIQEGFDPSLVAGGYGFDEGFAVPLTLLSSTMSVPVVPVVVNTVHEPYPSLRRCHGLGAALRRVLERQKVAGRVVLLGTGGLSHWVGLPRAGDIDVAFDRRFLDALGSGNSTELLSLTDEEIDKAGNGAHEIRAWVVVAGAVSGSPFEVLAYEPTPEWLTGTAVARAQMGGR